MRTIVIVASAALLLSGCAAGQAEQHFPDLTEIHTAGPGSYTGYLDFVRQHRWQEGSIPQPIVQDAAECASQVLYNMLSDSERSQIDQAARGTGFSTQDEQGFARAFKSRVSRNEFSSAVDRECSREQAAYEQASR